MEITSILPEECLCLIISLTSPEDACRSAMISHASRSVANRDEVWERFLPSDCRSIISGSSSSSLLSLGKKDVYFHLCFHPILIQNGTMSFQLEKKSGKKCYMMGARALSIIQGDTPAHWIWTSLQESSDGEKPTFAFKSMTKRMALSIFPLFTCCFEFPLFTSCFEFFNRFPETAELKQVGWLHMRGKIETKILSSDTNYAVYFVFKLRKEHTTGFTQRSVGFHVHVDKIDLREVRMVSLDPLRDESQYIRERGDGWMEIEMGAFFNNCGDDGSVEFSIWEAHTNYVKQGLIIEGIELKPKDIAS
ncbi:putative F-box protein PP2-B12 isoform X1 [Gossypium hirsutum]|uniref:F-box protein PP2-B12 isoform X1 n=1 Tax=Gossypium hirsutum TaxID=3635 RepID=A0ABM2YT28_GOSHI|nr:putative F-box protein PP2-B12 isoform X1 [Gossypium hirsutum]